MSIKKQRDRKDEKIMHPKNTFKKDKIDYLNKFLVNKY